MNIRDFTKSILLTNEGNKLFLSIRNFTNDGNINNRSIEVDNVLDNSVIKNFLSSNIKSIKCVKSHIGNNQYKECIELKNNSNSSLIIISDDTNKYFKELLEYIKENRAKIYERSLFDSLCKNSLDEIVFTLSYNNSNSEILINNVDNKNRLTYFIPYEVNEEGTKVISDEDLELIQKTINSYFIISGCKLKYVYDDSAMGYVLGYQMITDKAKILINDSEIYYQLELYFNLIRRDSEKIYLEEREKNYKKSKRNMLKNKLKILRKEDNNDNKE